MSTDPKAKLPPGDDGSAKMQGVAGDAYGLAELTQAYGASRTTLQLVPWRWSMGLFGVLVALAASQPAAAEALAPIQLSIIGGLPRVSQFTRYEAPFWTNQVPRLTEGRVRADIKSSDQVSIRGSEMLQLMRLGVVPFGTLTLAVAASEEPEISAIDLPLLNPNIATLRQTVALLRPRLQDLLRDRYSVELLAVYTYPAQVVFCRQPFASLSDLKDRRVRASSVAQSEMLQALGATPIVVPFVEIVRAIRDGVVDCAITGTLSGNAIGLHTVTTHISSQAISWGVSFFGANAGAWAALPPRVREQLQAGLAGLESDIWQAAGQETEAGFACNAGRAECDQGTAGRMVVVDDELRDRLRRSQLLREVVLPAWVDRCGNECAEVWNRYMAPTRGINAERQ